MKKLTFRFMIIITIFCIGFLVACFEEHSTQEKLVKDYLATTVKLMEKGFKEADCEKLAGLQSPKDSYVYKQTVAGLKLVGAIFAMFGTDISIKIKVLEFSSWNMEEDKGTVMVKIKVDSKVGDKVKNEEQQSLATFEKIDNKWYITDFDADFFDV